MARNELERRNTEQVNRRMKGLINKSKDVDENLIRYS